MKKNIVIGVFVMVMGCQPKEIIESEIESIISKKTYSEQTSIMLEETTTTINNETPKVEKYLLLRLINPKSLIEVKQNERALNFKINLLKKYITDSIIWDSSVQFDDIRIQIIEKSGFLIKNEETLTIKLNKN